MVEDFWFYQTTVHCGLAHSEESRFPICCPILQNSS